VPVALGAAAFMSATHGLTTLVWTTVPDNAGWTTPPGWYVLAVPALAGLLVAAALRLPGHGGEPAVKGIALEPLSPVQLVSALLAALATLGLGLVLGPEAPLTALGLTAGLVAARALRSGASGGVSRGDSVASGGGPAFITGLLGEGEPGRFVPHPRTRITRDGGVDRIEG